MKSKVRFALALAGAPVAQALAQSYDDLTFVRNRQQPFAQLLQLRAGIVGAFSSDEDPLTGLEDGVGWDGSAFYHDESFGGRGGQFDFYGGRDGLLASLRDGAIVGNETVSRLDLTARIWPFYREGSYNDDKFVPTGLYEGTDYGAYMGFGREITQGLFFEFGPFFRRYSFARHDLTHPQFVIPDDFNAYGGKVFVEQNTVQIDRRSGLANDGFLITLGGEREWNDSGREFGLDPFLVELPSAVWRAHGHLEWYVAQTDATCWEIFVDGSLTDERDRIYNYDAQHPLGNLWVDGQLRFRIRLGEALTLTPFVHGQYVRILRDDLASADKQTFFGGGGELLLNLGDAMSIYGNYSFLDNESRPSIRVDEDVHGQHMFQAGVIVRFGATRR